VELVEELPQGPPPQQSVAEDAVEIVEVGADVPALL
jgi:hypothetical protein